MNEEQIREVADLVAGLVAGRVIEAHERQKWLPNHRERVKQVSHNAGAYVAGQLREMFRKQAA